jgi:hypothetical protein
MPRVGAVVDPAWTPKCRRPALCRVRYCSASGKIADRRPHDRVDCCSVRSADAENRIPEPNCNSSGWIRTIDLTIMSRAPWCEGRARAGAGSGEIHARRPFRRNLWLPGSSARIHVRGPVVDPEKRGCSWARGADLDGARAHLLSLIDPRSRGTVGLLSRGSQVRILPGASAGRSRDREIPAKGDPLSSGGQALGEKRRHSAPLTNFEVASWSHFAADRRPAKGIPNSRVAQTRAVCEAPPASPRISTVACQSDSVSGSRAWLRARGLA